MSTEPTTYAMVVARHDERIDWLFYYTQHFSLTAFVYMASQKHAGPDHGQPALQRPPSAPELTLSSSLSQPQAPASLRRSVAVARPAVATRACLRSASACLPS